MIVGDRGGFAPFLSPRRAAAGIPSENTRRRQRDAAVFPYGFRPFSTPLRESPAYEKSQFTPAEKCGIMEIAQ